MFIDVSMFLWSNHMKLSVTRSLVPYTIITVWIFYSKLSMQYSTTLLPITYLMLYSSCPNHLLLSDVSVSVSLFHLCVSIHVCVLELSLMLRGFDLDWQWCTGRPIIQSPTWQMVDILPPCPAPPQGTLASSCRVRHFDKSFIFALSVVYPFLMAQTCHITGFFQEFDSFFSRKWGKLKK